MNKKFLIAIITVFALMVGAIIYLLLTNNSPNPSNPNGNNAVTDPRDNYIRLLSGNLAEQLNTYAYNDYSNLRIAYSQSNEPYKSQIDSRIVELQRSQTIDTNVITEANRSAIKYSETNNQLTVTVPLLVTEINGTKVNKIFSLILEPVENDWLLIGANLQ